MNFTYEVHLVADGKFGTQERVRVGLWKPARDPVQVDPVWLGSGYRVGGACRLGGAWVGGAFEPGGVWSGRSRDGSGRETVRSGEQGPPAVAVSPPAVSPHR